MTKKADGDVEKKEGGDTIESHPVSENRVPPTPTTEDAKSLAIRLQETKEKELKGRVLALNLELTPLLTKHGFALSAEPYIENGQIKARPQIVDTRKDI